MPQSTQITGGGDQSGSSDIWNLILLFQSVYDKLRMQAHYKDTDEQVVQLSGCEHQGAGVAREGK